MVSLAVVVCEVFLDGVPIGYKLLRDTIKAFLLDRAIEPFDVGIVVWLANS